jgi:hypothetical protein
MVNNILSLYVDGAISLALCAVRTAGFQVVGRNLPWVFLRILKKQYRQWCCSLSENLQIDISMSKYISEITLETLHCFLVSLLNFSFCFPIRLSFSNVEILFYTSFVFFIVLHTKGKIPQCLKPDNILEGQLCLLAMWVWASWILWASCLSNRDNTYSIRFSQVTEIRQHSWHFWNEICQWQLPSFCPSWIIIDYYWLNLNIVQKHIIWCSTNYIFLAMGNIFFSDVKNPGPATKCLPFFCTVVSVKTTQAPPGEQEDNFLAIGTRLWLEFCSSYEFPGR